MDIITQIVSLPGYRAVFERSGELLPPGADIPAAAAARLVCLRVLFFALARSSLPGGSQLNRLSGVVLDPDYGYLGLCEPVDGQSHPGRFLGYLPPGGSPTLLDTYRWMIAAHLDDRFASEAAWRQARAEQIP